MRSTWCVGSVVSRFSSRSSARVLVTEGATWQRQPRMLQGAFTPRRAAGYAKLMVQATGDCIDAAVPAGQASALLDMGALFTRLTMDVILRTLFSSRASDDAAVTSRAVQLLSATAMREMFRPLTLPDWLPLPGKTAKAAVITRRTTQAITLGGHRLPRGALLRITPWVLHRDARWFSEPLKFLPDRFMPDAEPLVRGAWMPFGAGPRVCLGQHFAMLEMTLAAAMLSQRYTLTPPAGSQPPDPVLNVTLRPKHKHGLHLHLHRRKPA